MEKKKSFEIRLVEFQNQLTQIIGNCDLNVSIVELVLRNLYNEVKQLTEENLQRIVEQEAKKQEEDTDGNTNEER